MAGFEEVAFLDEPTAALMGEELAQGVVMAVDFGGGTFDVSIIALSPSQGDVLATHGAAIGGELFDSLLFDSKVAPELKLDREYLINGKVVPVPTVLRRMRTLHGIIAMVADEVTHRAFEFMRQAPGHPLDMVEEIIYGGHAYNFFRAVEAAKNRVVLSSRCQGELSPPGDRCVNPGVSLGVRLARQTQP